MSSRTTERPQSPRCQPVGQTVGVRLGRWFVRLLSAGEVGEPDPEAQVEVADVPIGSGPMLIAALERSGIIADGIESFDVVTETRSRMRIMVRRRDAEPASRVVAEVGWG